ncbi:MAG: hypothetical protein KDF59_06750 [Nitrosomonas sp.]|nr:hypothetical protein [Nitrosomonas sp.]
MSRVLIPDAMTNAKLISSNISEPDTGETAYNAETTYSIGDECIVISGELHDKFESLQNNNLGNTPVPLPGESAFWLHKGRTNQRNPFDLTASYKASRTSPINYVIAPGKKIDSVAIGGMFCDFAQLIVKDGSSVELFNDTQDVKLRDVGNSYYNFFNTGYYEKHIIMWDNLPSARDGTFELILTGSGTINLEWLAFGDVVYLGDEEFNAIDDELNFSTIDRRTTGELVMVPKISAFKPTVKTSIHPKYLRSVRRARSLLNAKPAIWNMYENKALDYHDFYLFKGIYRGFSITSDNHKEATIDFDFEGV